MTVDIENVIPRSEDYLGKTIVATGFMFIHGTYYYKRIFSDGCAELVRYDQSAEKWVILCFSNIAE